MQDVDNILRPLRLALFEIVLSFIGILRIQKQQYMNILDVGLQLRYLDTNVEVLDGCINVLKPLRFE